MKATLIKTVGKTFIKSDYNKNFITELKNKIPLKSRRWNTTSSTDLLFRLITKIPRDRLLEETIISGLKTLCNSGILTKTWEIDSKYYSHVRDLCLKHFLEVYESEDTSTKRIFASNTMNYSKVNFHMENMLKEAEKYAPGKDTSFQWSFEASTDTISKKDNLNFQFYSPTSDKWFFGTKFSYGPKSEIAPRISSQTRYFKGEKTEDGYSYKWKGSFFCPENTLFKFRNHYYLVRGQDKLHVLGQDMEGWTKAKQIEEYQKILLRLDEIITEKESIEAFLAKKPLQITDIKFPEKPVFPPAKTIEITETTN